MSSKATSINTIRDSEDNLDCYWISALPVDYRNNDALNFYLKTDKERLEDAYVAAMTRVKNLPRWEGYVERYVDPRFQSYKCEDEVIRTFKRNALVLDKYQEAVGTPVENKPQGRLSKFRLNCCSPPQVKY